MVYSAIITEVEDGWYMGQCEQVPGAITQGQTVEEVQENMREAITLVLQSEQAHCCSIYEGERYIRREIAFA